MLATLPGTVIETDLARPGADDRIFAPMFMAGGLVLSQVVEITGLAPYVIQNWVKRGFLPPPENKKYTRRQLSRIVIINMLKDSMQLEKIANMLRFINGRLDDTSDDAIDDVKLYGYFTGLVAILNDGFPGRSALDSAVMSAIAGYAPPFPGAEGRLKTVLEIMLLAYASGRLKREADRKLSALDI